ncbi:MAG: serine protease [Halioglobus sp.]|nr:serine protease [Halioglobus sp.]
MRYKFAVLCLLLLAGLAAPSASAADAWLIEIDGPIGPAIADHMVRGLEQAQAAGAVLVILRIDTPGGLDTAMREMIKAMLAAEVPLVAHVAPGGARAASAGTYLLYASHVAAMAPGTNLGAATPVQIASPGMPQIPAEDKPEEEEAAPQAGSAMEKKLVNDAVAYIQSLAQLRGRNAQWAERAVREGASLSAEDALAAGVIEIIALDSAELLRALDGREVLVGATRHTLQTRDLGIYTHPVDWRSEFLAVITNPNVAYILMLVGIYGLLLEFYNPGVGLPGVTGAICLLLALYAFQALPVSYAGVALILLGIALMTAEAFAPSFGVLGLGGVGAFVFGSIMLMDTEMPAYQVALPMILAVAVFSAGLLVFVMGMLVRARRQVVVSGLEQLRGAVATVESIDGGHARVRLEGELWSVRCDEPLAANDRVTVDAVDGVTLRVHKTER